jgi:hypothetical protein
MSPHVAAEFLPEICAAGVALIALGFAAIVWRALRSRF